MIITLLSLLLLVAVAIKQETRKVRMKLSELTAKTAALEAQFDKARAEIIAEIQRLKDALADVDVPAAAEASLNNLTTLAQALDDINPDAA